ncbi:MAG TPA: DUF2197 domain-containing protein [Syntrophomonadaceae bacterium]|nr:DUF2197 domain-containing protein [Syntrophomonadaceae bacterium]
MNFIEARCLMCGKVYQIAQDRQEFRKLDKQNSTTFICHLCSNKVRYEAEERDKPKKPLPPSS